MERKKIDNMVQHCRRQFLCGGCQCEKLCDEVSDVLSGSGISIVPAHWTDDDIDYILDEIN